MKGLIAIAVVVIHLVVVILILRARQSSTPTETAAPPSAETPSAAAKPTAAAPTGPSKATSSAPRKMQPPLSTQLRSALAELPADLQQQSQAASSAIVVDWDRKLILWQKQPQQAVPIASMTKMMTALLLMERLDQDPDLTLQTQVRVTPATMRIGGSQVYLDPRESFSIDDLLRCIMIFSANDAAFLIGEFLGNGSEATFIDQMNARARELGMNSFRFFNTHGLPSDAGINRGNVVDLALLAGRLLEYDDVVKWASTWLSYLREDTKPFQLVNRNRLVRSCDGVNGMKTGYTRDAGFCVAATAQRHGGRRMIVVVTGCASANERNDLVAALFDWGYQQAAIAAATAMEP